MSLRSQLLPSYCSDYRCWEHDSYNVGHKNAHFSLTQLSTCAWKPLKIFVGVPSTQFFYSVQHVKSVCASQATILNWVVGNWTATHNLGKEMQHILEKNGRTTLEICGPKQGWFSMGINTFHHFIGLYRSQIATQDSQTPAMLSCSSLALNNSVVTKLWVMAPWEATDTS